MITRFLVCTSLAVVASGLDSHHREKTKHAHKHEHDNRLKFYTGADAGILSGNNVGNTLELTGLELSRRWFFFDNFFILKKIFEADRIDKTKSFWAQNRNLNICVIRFAESTFDSRVCAEGHIDVRHELLRHHHGLQTRLLLKSNSDFYWFKLILKVQNCVFLSKFLMFTRLLFGGPDANTSDGSKIRRSIQVKEGHWNQISGIWFFVEETFWRMKVF